MQAYAGWLTLEMTAGGRGGVAFWTHVGGFVTGLLTIENFEKRELSAAKRRGEKLSRERTAQLRW